VRLLTPQEVRPMDTSVYRLGHGTSRKWSTRSAPGITAIDRSVRGHFAAAFYTRRPAHRGSSATVGSTPSIETQGVFHECSGNHEMMAKQVKPISHRERKACQTDNAPASEFHQGQRLLASIKSPDLWLQSSPAYYHRLRAWQNRGDHLCVKTSKPV